MKYAHEDVAERHAKMWHQKERGWGVGDIKLNFDFPDVVQRLGRAEEIVYHSDKWEKDYDFCWRSWSSSLTTTATVCGR